MLRPTAVVLAFVLAACRKDAPTTTPPVALASERITEGDAVVQIDVGYRALPQREVEITVDLKAIGIYEMDKLVADITVEGFVHTAGEPEWSGFVAPRLPIAHRASFRLLEEQGAGTLTVRVQRSADSVSLYEATLPFVADGDRVAPGE